MNKKKIKWIVVCCRKMKRYCHLDGFRTNLLDKWKTKSERRYLRVKLSVVSSIDIDECIVKTEDLLIIYCPFCGKKFQVEEKVNKPLSKEERNKYMFF